MVLRLDDTVEDMMNDIKRRAANGDEGCIEWLMHQEAKESLRAWRIRLEAEGCLEWLEGQEAEEEKKE